MKRRAGFTMVEIMIVVAIISLLVGMAVPSMLKYRQGRQNGMVASQIRLACEAFELYKMDHGSWPANEWPGVVPAVMVPYFSQMRFSNAGIDWTADTMIGGDWDWDGNCQGFTAAVAIPGCHLPRSQMEGVDRMLDDGNLDTGKFRYESSQYTYVLEE